SIVVHSRHYREHLPAFPTRRSSDLVGGSEAAFEREEHPVPSTPELPADGFQGRHQVLAGQGVFHFVKAYPPGGRVDAMGGIDGVDRKSTRLNSSHVKISYAVFCLKK